MDFIGNIKTKNYNTKKPPDFDNLAIEQELLSSVYTRKNRANGKKINDTGYTDQMKIPTALYFAEAVRIV